MNKKKLFIILLLFATSFGINSQTLQIKAGIGQTLQRNISYPNIGIAGIIEINSKKNFQIELNYVTRNFTTEVNYKVLSGIQYAQYLPTYLQTYLEVPFQYKYLIGKNKNGDEQLSFNIGGYLAYRLTNKFKTLNSVDSRNGNNITIDYLNDNYNHDNIKASKIDFGLNTGITYRFRNSPFSLDLKYSQGLIGQQQRVFYYYDKIYTVDYFLIYNKISNPSPAKLKPNQNLEIALYYKFK